MALIQLNRNQLTHLTELFTGYRHYKVYFFKLKLVTVPRVKGFHDKEKTAIYVLCVCEVLTKWRFCHLGIHFMKPRGHLHITSLSSVLHFIWSAGLLESVIFEWDMQQMKGSHGPRVIQCPSLQYNLISQIIKNILSCILSLMHTFPLICSALLEVTILVLFPSFFH